MGVIYALPLLSAPGLWTSPKFSAKLFQAAFSAYPGQRFSAAPVRRLCGSG